MATASGYASVFYLGRRYLVVLSILGSMSKIVANHYVLAVHNLEESARWFVNTLGFEICNEPPGWIFVKRDNCMIMLGWCADSLPAADLGDHSYFAYLLVDNADELYEQVLATGTEVSMKLASKPWNMREFGLRTPEGHRIMIGHVLS